MTEPTPTRRPSRLARSPGGWDAGRMNDRGIRAAAAGDGAGAVAALRAALACDPAHAQAWTNLGKLLADHGDGEAGAAGHARALRLGLWHPLILFGLGVARRQAGDRAGAGLAFRAALALVPAHGDALNSLGNLAEDPGMAVALYLRALRAEPGLTIVHGNLAGALYRLHQSGRVDDAARTAALWLAMCPDDPTARHIAPTLIRRDGPEDGEVRASDAYVRTTFDQFAAEFEDTLTALGYCAPERLAAAVAAEGVEPESGLSILDAGCGTGLCAPFLRPAALWLEGVDLSGGMLERAQARGLYDRLTEAELTAFLTRHPARYDVILAADVLCYFGDLVAVLAAARDSLRPGGLLAFTVERLEGGAPYRVNPHGRYAHDRGYVTATVADAGLVLSVLRDEVLRLEGGRPVPGLLVTARHR